MRAKPWTRSAGQDALDPVQLHPDDRAVASRSCQRSASLNAPGRAARSSSDDGDQRVAHDALEVPQGLVPVEEDGLDHLGIR